MPELLDLPLLPLRGTVLFPGVAVPIAAGRPGSLRAIERALAGDQRVIAVAQREAEGDAVPENLFTVGTIARVEQVQRGPAGVNLLLHGLERASVVRIKEIDGRQDALVRPLEEVAPEEPGPMFEALRRELRARAVEVGEKAGMPADAVEQLLSRVEKDGRLADLIAAYLDAPVADRQEVLETLAVEDRLHRVLVLAQRQLAVLDAQADIQSRVQAELGQRQREAALREQMRAIQEELGEGGGEDIAELRERLEAIDLPEVARKEVDRELARLERQGRDGMEGQVIRTFLETVAELPWNERSEEKIDLQAAAKILDEDHHGLSSVKDRVLEFLAVRKLHQRKGDETSSSKGPILLFAGPPGVGKTSIAKSIARSMGREYVRVSLGGARDQADISGHRRTYVGAMPGRIIQGLKQAGTKNPVFLLDEIDKLGASYQGDPAAALLEVLDPAQNDSFTDHYLGVPFDLSEVLFVATANYLERMPHALLDRMEVVEFSGYTEREKLGIARSYLLPRQIEGSALQSDELEVTDAALAEVIGRYTREAGVRQLERQLGTLVRKVARRIADGDDEVVRVDAGDVGRLLGRPTVRPERAETHDMFGTATGMYYTPAGGDIMFVEATAMPGKGNLVLTGQLGDVMRESAQAAWSYARAHARGLHIPEGAFEGDLHVHVPAGAIPKDGPSAGVTMATAIVSALARRPVRPDVAMTGEITLSGRVLPIGGVKEKVLGGVRAGITTFLLPAANERDLEDLPEDVRDSITVHLVSELGEVLAHTLRDATYVEGRLLFEGDDPRDVEPLSEALRLAS